MNLECSKWPAVGSSADDTSIDDLVMLEEYVLVAIICPIKVSLTTADSYGNSSFSYFSLFWSNFLSLWFATSGKLIALYLGIYSLMNKPEHNSGHEVNLYLNLSGEPLSDSGKPSIF